MTESEFRKLVMEALKTIDAELKDIKRQVADMQPLQ
jgi:hypothetical protein